MGLQEIVWATESSDKMIDSKVKKKALHSQAKYLKTCRPPWQKS